MVQFNWTYEEVVLAGDLVATNDWKGLRKDDPRVADLSSLLRAASIHPVEGRSDNFRSINSIARKTYDIATLHPDYDGEATKGGRHDAKVLWEYMSEPERMHALAHAVRASLLKQAVASLNSTDLEVLSTQAGMPHALAHLHREQDGRARSLRIDTALSMEGALRCEVCEFDFAHVYGELGKEYIEVHHVRPLHEPGPANTRPEDLALLCSNCHRMIHRAQPWLNPAQLAGRLEP